MRQLHRELIGLEGGKRASRIEEMNKDMVGGKKRRKVIKGFGMEHKIDKSKEGSK